MAMPSLPKNKNENLLSSFLAILFGGAESGFCIGPSLGCFRPSYLDLSLAFSRWKGSYAACTAVTQVYCSVSFFGVLCSSIWRLWRALVRASFFFCSVRRTEFCSLWSVVTGGKRLKGSVWREKSNRELRALWRDCCWEKRGRKRVKRGARDRSATIMRLMRDREGTEWVDAKSSSLTTLATVVAGLKKRRSSCRSAYWTDRIAGREGGVRSLSKKSLVSKRPMTRGKRENFWQLSEQR